MTRRAATPAPDATTAADPLADVRAQFGGTDDDARGLPEAAPATAPVSLVRAPQADADTQPAPLDLVALNDVLVASWHADTVAMGFLHKGGRCGCAYMARVGLAALVPAVEASDEPEQGTT